MKRRVLFVCIGNACRSQMAEGFARAYGGDVMEAFSAGLMPIQSVPGPTRQTMIEKNVPIDMQYPKGIEIYRQHAFDLVVNMSGEPLPKPFSEQTRSWVIADPYRRNPGVFRQVRDEIERRVMELILELRRTPVEAAKFPVVPLRW